MDALRRAPLGDTIPVLALRFFKITLAPDNPHQNTILRVHGLLSRLG
jgi:hypothetical protein